MVQEYKQVIVVRTDIKMGKGKIAAQVAHAAVACADEVRKHRPKIYEGWIKCGQPKIVVKVNSLERLLDIKEKAEGAGLITVLIEDRGLTQVPVGTKTCVGIGPDLSEIIDKITGELPLL
ncbi:MAG: peptidyl-tRNA hydrolase Pth2 [Nitrososphaerota archaeon]|nr:peptidyl-tRNA hydrolase Pth2 [Nitrososphaerales archaeon]MDW8044607.1 peptidyl-tRNA hydrolase Pth2 [Nitrososphaerota archaeon]